jgi:nucleoside-diphosphate-sugar epimerase
MSRYYVAGHRGMVGSAIHRQLLARGEQVIIRSRDELDLLDQQATRSFLQQQRPDVVIVAAAKVGGIVANSSYPASFIHENLAIETNLIHESYKAGVSRLLFLGSSCIYPRLAPQPIPESALLTGPLEPTNEAYAIAKIAGIKLCEAYNRQYGTDYRSVMPTNIYGPGDNFHPQNSHVLPALIRRFHEAAKDGQAEVVVWGSGKPRREFLHADDVAAACLVVLDTARGDYEAVTEPTVSHVNIGAGEDVTIADLAQMVASVTGFRGRITFDISKPDGTPRKLLDVSRLSALGWRARRDLEDGIADAYRWFCENHAELRV